jgi:hypothetical protein
MVAMDEPRALESIPWASSLSRIRPSSDMESLLKPFFKRKPSTIIFASFRPIYSERMPSICETLLPEGSIFGA